jgi:hypothetical protein
VIIDSPDLLHHSSAAREYRHKIDECYLDARALATEMQIPVWSAAKISKEGAKMSLAGLEQLAEDWGIAYTADVAVFINQDESEIDDGILHLHIGKSRYSRRRQVIDLHVDQATLNIED